MKLICATIVLVLCIQTAISESDDWMTWAGKFEGDIALTPEQERVLLPERQLNGTERNGIKSLSRRWTNGRMPYVIPDASGFSASEKNLIRKAMDDYAAKTCIQFVERTNERDYIKFVREGGCWSYVGRTGGEQKVSLVGGCMHHYIIIHELMHAAGFYHEQSRPDRDNYVTINWGNICCGASSNFRKQTTATVQTFNEPYDLTSVMHYRETAFSTDRRNKKTIVAKDGTSPLGNNVGFSQVDINKLNKLYQCDGGAGTTTTTAPATTPSASCTNMLGDGNCSRWARSSLQTCTNDKYKYFMMDACAKACNFCGCFDKHPAVCDSWKNQGICRWSNIYGTWMKKYCPKSCGSCS